jgi:hypothetical protein
MSEELRWPVLIVASACAVSVLTILGVSGPVRVLVALWFLLACTGMAFLPLLGIRVSRPAAIALVVVLSIVVDTLVATGLTLVGRLSDVGAVLALAGVAILGCGLQLAAGPALEGADATKGLGRPASSGAHEPVSSPDR